MVRSAPSTLRWMSRCRGVCVADSPSLVAAAGACAGPGVGSGGFCCNSRFNSSTFPELGSTVSGTWWDAGAAASCPWAGFIASSLIAILTAPRHLGRERLDPARDPGQAVSALGADELVQPDVPEEPLHV